MEDPFPFLALPIEFLLMRHAQDWAHSERRKTSGGTKQRKSYLSLSRYNCRFSEAL